MLKEEIILNEKIVQKIKILLDQRQELTKELTSIVYTILDYENIEGPYNLWDFKMENGQIDITRLAKIKQEENIEEL